MVKKLYEFTLEKYDEGFRVRLINYRDEDRNFKSPTPMTKQDKRVVKTLTTLLEELDSDELNVKIEVQ